MKRIVKQLLMLLAAAALILSGCCTKSELEEVKQEVSSLTERVASIENTQLKALESQIASIQKEIAQLQNADKVQAEDVSALEGKMSVISDDLAQLKESVSSLDGTTEELSGKIAGINAKLSELETQITSILASINELKARVSGGDVTLSYIPKYAYGNELVQYTRDTLKISGTVTLNFTVLPSSAAETIVKDWKSSLSTIAYPLTRADGGESVELAVSDASAKDGVLSVTIDCSKLGKDFILNNTGAALALKVSCGDIQIVSDYIKLSPAMEEKAFIKYLLNNFDTDGDGQVEISEVNKATELNISNMGITSLDGVLEQMPALTTLDCSNNELTSIDLSKNESLTGVDLRNNANLTKVVCKSLDWILAKPIYTDAVALFYKPDGTQITWDTSLTTEIDGKTWKQFNVGTRLGNKYGDKYNFDDAQSACPTGWRAPTFAEIRSLAAHYSNWTTYLGMKGRWFSGSQTYSSTAPAIFLPVKSLGSSIGYYWSSTEYTSDFAYYLYFYSGIVYVGYSRSNEMSVRCLKDDGDGGNGGEETDAEPTSATKVSIKEFLEKPVSDTDWYELTGTIKSIAKADYGNITIEDESGSVYVYGVVKAWANGENDKSFSSLGLKVTDVVTIWTLRAEFNGLALAGGTPPAIYKSHTEGAGETYPAGTVVLSFPDENQSANKVNDYVSTWTAKIGSNEFSIANFNNFKWDGWTYIKCGRKKDASVASIFTQTPIAVKVTKLQLAADTYDASSMNSLTLNVYSDAAKATKVLSQVASDPKAGTIEFAIDADKQAAGLYYELVFDCKVSSISMNGFIRISKVAYLAAE